MERPDVKFVIMLNRAILLVVMLKCGLSTSIILLIVTRVVSYTCKRCGKQYVGSTITSFRIRFNNHEFFMKPVWEGAERYLWGALVCPFWEDGHKGLEDVNSQIIDVTNVRDPTCREAFWFEKLNSC